MFKQFAEAVKAYGIATNIIISHNLWLYFLYPVILFVLLFVGGTALIGEAADYLQTLIISWTGLSAKGSSELSMLATALNFILNIALRILFFFLYSAMIKYLILILLSPVLALLSERTDEIITGKKYSFNLRQLMKDALRGSLIAFRNMIIQFALILSCFALMMIPVIGWLAPFFLLIVNYYFYGFAMMDYTNERYKLNISESIRFVKKNKGLAIGNGFIFAVLFAIPFAGVVIAPILGVVAATVASVHTHKTDQDISHGKN